MYYQTIEKYVKSTEILFQETIRSYPFRVIKGICLRTIRVTRDAEKDSRLNDLEISSASSFNFVIQSCDFS